MPKVGRRSPAPRFHRREHIHAEAYPALNVRAAHKQVLLGHNHVLWMDQRGRVHGQGFATLDGSVLDLSWHLRSFLEDDGQVHKRELKLEAVDEPGRVVDMLTKCPDCKEKMRVLVLMDGIWACHSCQGLVRRSTLIGEVARKSEKLVKLREELAGGRPKGMHNTTYNARLADLRELEREVGTPSASNAAYGNVLTAWWQRDGPLLMKEGELVRWGPEHEDVR